MSVHVDSRLITTLSCTFERSSQDGEIGMKVNGTQNFYKTVINQMFSVQSTVRTISEWILVWTRLVQSNAAYHTYQKYWNKSGVRINWMFPSIACTTYSQDGSLRARLRLTILLGLHRHAGRLEALWSVSLRQARTFAKVAPFILKLQSAVLYTDI